MGALSDRFGRRPVVLLSNLGLGLDYVLMALAPNLAWLFVGRVISGITAASVSTGMAYIADVTPPEKRSGAFGMLGVAFGLGFVFGPALGGVLGSVDPRLPFWVAAGLSLANAAYGYFVLPESLPPEKRRPFEWRRANPLGSLQAAALASRAHRPRRASCSSATWRTRRCPRRSCCTRVIATAGTRGPSGSRSAVIGVCSAVVQGTLVAPLVRRFGERRGC